MKLPENSKIPTKTAAAADILSFTNMAEWTYPQLIFTEKIIFINNVKAILESAGILKMHFPAICSPRFQILPLESTMGIPHEDELSKQQRNLISEEKWL